MSAPAQPTEHFPAYSIVNVTDSTKVTVQSGTRASTQSLSIVTSEENAALVALLVEMTSAAEPRSSWSAARRGRRLDSCWRAALADPAQDRGRIEHSFKGIAAAVCGAFATGAAVPTNSQTIVALIQRLLRLA
jgi:hypothetical protein